MIFHLNCVLPLALPASDHVLHLISRSTILKFAFDSPVYIGRTLHHSSRHRSPRATSPGRGTRFSLRSTIGHTTTVSKTVNLGTYITYQSNRTWSDRLRNGWNRVAYVYWDAGLWRPGKPAVQQRWQQEEYLVFHAGQCG